MNREHEILIIAKNTNGIVARIMSLFNRRGYAVNKMTAGVTNYGKQLINEGIPSGFSLC